MTKAAYLSSLQHRLQNIESRIAADKKRIETGAAREKVEAAGDLAYLERQLSDTRKEIANLEGEPDGSWENLVVAVEQNIDSIEEAAIRWSERQEEAFEKTRDTGDETKG